MRTVPELEAELELLARRLRALEMGELPSRLSVREALDALNRQAADLRRDLDELKRVQAIESQAVPPQPVDDQPSGEGTGLGLDAQSPGGPDMPCPVAEPRPRRMDERILGKYIIGVLASGLILLAAVTLITAAWDMIPDLVKFAGLYLIGVGLGLSGVKRGSGNRANGFWTCLAGLGAALRFLTMAAGHLAWGLYGPEWLGIMSATWFMTNLCTAAVLKSVTFHAVTYIGGFISTCLALAAVTSGGAAGQAVLLTGCIALIGLMAQRAGLHKVLSAMNLAFAGLAGTGFLGTASALNAMSGPGREAAVLAWSAAVLFGMGTALCGRLFKHSMLVASVTGAVGLCLACASCSAAAPESAILAPVIALAIIMISVMAGGPGALLPGAMPVVAVELGAMSEGLFGCMTPLPCVGLMAVCLSSVPRDSKPVRVGAWAAMLPATIMALGRDGELLPCTIAGAAFVIAVLALSWRDMASGPAFAVGPVAGAILAGLVSGGSFDAVLGLSCGTGVPMAAFLLGYRWALARKRDDGTYSVPGRAIWYLAAAMTGLFVQESLGTARGFDAFLGLAVLSAFAASATASAILFGAWSRTVLALLSVHGASATGCTYVLGTEGLAVSLCGLAISVGFVAAGFARKRRTLRLGGLGTMILYVLKIALLDVQAVGSVPATIGALLAAGVTCLAVSYAYNKLDRKYGSDEK